MAFERAVLAGDVRSNLKEIEGERGIKIARGFVFFCGQLFWVFVMKGLEFVSKKLVYFRERNSGVFIHFENVVGVAKLVVHFSMNGMGLI